MAGLGYERYGAQGGDWGSMISTQLGLADPEHVAGLHLNMVVAPPPADLDFEHLRDDEQAALASFDYYGRVDSGYSKIQGTKPQTIGYALDDSPAGLAGWIVEKFRTWSDCDGDVERSLHQGPAARQHHAVLAHRHRPLGGAPLLRGRADRHVRRPTAGRGPRRGRRVPEGDHPPAPPWAEQRYDILHWTDMPRGGHFAAFEEPELLVDDVREFFRPLGSAGEFGPSV